MELRLLNLGKQMSAPSRQPSEWLSFITVCLETFTNDKISVTPTLPYATFSLRSDDWEDPSLGMAVKLFPERPDWWVKSPCLGGPYTKELEQKECCLLPLQLLQEQRICCCSGPPHTTRSIFSFPVWSDYLWLPEKLPGLWCGTDSTELLSFL